MTKSAICHNCNGNGITADRAGPVYCDCLTGLNAAMAFVSESLNTVTETRQALIDAGLTDRARSVEVLRLELEAEYDAFEAEYNRRCENE